MLKMIFILLIILIANQAKADRYILFFHADWCKACPYMIQNAKAPENIILYKKYDKVYMVNVDTRPTWKKTFGITKIPTVIIADSPNKAGAKFTILAKFTGYNRVEMNQNLLKFIPKK